VTTFHSTSAFIVSANLARCWVTWL